MMDFAEARRIVLQHCPRLPRTTLTAARALGCVLAEPIIARAPVPRFAASAVDGYAVCSNDLRPASRKRPVALILQDTVPAGDTRRTRLIPGHVIRILTGAVIPRGADSIVMQEHVRTRRKTVVFPTPAAPWENIRGRGGEFRKSAVLLASGVLVTPPVIALLATLGQKRVRVYRKPRVALVVTGNEVRAPGTVLRRGQIHDANTAGCVAALKAAGIGRIKTFRTGDSLRRLNLTFRRAFAQADVVLSSGGVSVGAGDLVKDVLGTLRVRSIFWRVAIKPGKPIFFGKQGKKVVFGLPGNPVAAHVCIQLFVKPALLRMMGSRETDLLTFTARLDGRLVKQPGRMEFARGVLTNDAAGKPRVCPSKGQESHMLGGLAAANCLIHLPKGRNRFSAGASVTVSPLQWSLP
jgi:molybdopterin molybdotransferase